MTDTSYELPPLEERPLVTFALFAYNQEEYIREAVEGALEQTYEPLEIILSDDFSTDRTFEIMRAIVESYRGPHQVRLVRNSENLGIAPHVHKVDLEAKGSLIVHAAGDDISAPSRTARLVSNWLSFENRPSIIVSNAYRVSPEGLVEGLLVDKNHGSCMMNGADNKFYSVLGCSLAVDKTLFSVFDTIDKRILAEDVVLYRRAELLNGIYYIKDPLVKWRHHYKSITHSGHGDRLKYLNWEKKWATDTLIRINQSEKDRQRVNLVGSGYSNNYVKFTRLKLDSLEINPAVAALNLLISFVKREILLMQAKEIAKIILVRLRIITP